jgi:hypothetical protein
MTVHIGQITSEVRSTAPVHPDRTADKETSPWDERVRIAAMLERVARDRRRTSTGVEDD